MNELETKIWEIFNILLESEPKTINSNRLTYVVNNESIYIRWHAIEYDYEYKGLNANNPLEFSKDFGLYYFNMEACDLTKNIRFILELPHRNYDIRELSFDEQYKYKTKLINIYKEFEKKYIGNLYQKIVTCTFDDTVKCFSNK